MDTLERTVTAILMLASLAGVIGVCLGFTPPQWAIALVAFAALGQGAAARMRLQVKGLY